MQHEIEPRDEAQTTPAGHDHEHVATSPNGHTLDAAGWDERYSGEAVWSGNPNQALVTEVEVLTAAGLAPGSALDIGCGEGADAVWLALHGWRVTALDISGNAVARTEKAADAAGAEVHGVVGAFGEASLDQTFDLVSAMYPVLAKEQVALDDLLALVAPGGTLLYVHHADLGHAAEHGWDPDDYLQPHDVAEQLADREGWRVVVDEQRGRHVETGGGAGHTSDHVVRVQRL